MDEVEIVRNIENAGFAAKRRNMHYEILGDPIFRERDVPRMLELATAREDGRHARARRAARATPADAQPAPRKLRLEPARSSASTRSWLPRALGAADRASPPIRDGWVALDRWPRSRRSAARRAAVACRAATARRRGRSRQRRGPAGARQRAHAPRAVVAARRGAAGVEFADVGARRCMARAPDAGPIRTRRRSIDARGSPCMRGVGHGTASSATSANTLRHVRAARDEPARRRGLFYELIRLQRADAGRAWSTQALPRTRARSADERRACRVSLAPHAPYSVAPRAASGDPTAIDAMPFAAVQRAPGGVGRGSRVHSDRRAARGGRCSRSSAPGIRRGRPPGAARCEYLDDMRLSRRRACWPCTACRCRRRILGGCARAGATLVTCPRSNGHAGAGAPPIDAVLRVGRPRRDRHRQPRERRRPEPVSPSWPTMRATGAGGAGGGAARQRDASTGRSALGFEPRLRHDRARQAVALPVCGVLPATSTMWKNIW